MRRRGWLFVVAAVSILGAAAWAFLKVRPEPVPTPEQVQAAFQAKDWPLAERLLTRLAETRPGDGRVFVQLGAVRSLQGRDDDALQALDSVPPDAAAYGEARSLLGDILQKKGDAARAEAEFRKAVAADPKAARPLQRLIYLLLLEARNEEASEKLQALYAIDRDPRSIVTLTRQAVAEGDARDITDELERFLKTTPDDPWLRRARGFTRLKLGRVDAALEDLEFARSRIERDPTLETALAETLLLAGRLDRAKALVGEVPADRVEAGRRLVLRGRIAEAEKDDARALKNYEAATLADPQNRIAHFRLAETTKRIGDGGKVAVAAEKAEAIRRLEAELRGAVDAQLKGSATRSPAPYVRLAELCLARRLPFEAKAWYEQALRLDPTATDLRSRMAAITVEDRPSVLPRLRAESLATGSTGETRNDEGSPLHFKDVAAEHGLVFTYDPHAKGDLFIGDTMGGGVALFDYDGDGDLDVYFVGGCPLPIDPAKPPAPNRLFRNDGKGFFEDVTARAGVGGRGYGMGASVGDYDRDGRPDLFVTGLGSTVLYRNRGDGTFEDVTTRAGVASKRWTTASAFADLDGDGDLDLVAITYVDADPTKVPDCRDQLNKPIHCPPTRFEAQLDHLFRNNGDGTFTDVAESSGWNVPKGDGLGLAIADFDDDGRLDVFVANDTEPNFLFRNKEAWKFVEDGVAAGVALDGNGRATASMGVVADDLDGDGVLDLFHTNFNNEPNTFLKGIGGGFFRDATAEAGLEAPSRALTGFGANPIDADNDGRLDLFVANGHVDDQPWFQIPMAQPPHLYQADRGGRFRLAPSTIGPYFERAVVGRGSAVGDLDGDGRQDLVVVHRGEPAVFLRNETEAGARLSIRLHGTKSAPTPVGASVEVKVGGVTLVRRLAVGTSYLSGDDDALWFGLGRAERVDALTVVWPSGRRSEFAGLKPGRYELTEEGEPTPR